MNRVLLASSAVILSSLIATPAMASTSIPDGSVTSAKIKDGTITSTDVAPNSLGGGRIKDGSLGVADFSSATRKALTGPAGPRGATGATGATGPQGATGPAGAGFNNISYENQNSSTPGTTTAYCYGGNAIEGGYKVTGSGSFEITGSYPWSNGNGDTGWTVTWTSPSGSGVEMMVYAVCSS